MIGCDCNAGLANTGRPGCVPLFSIVSSLILVPLTANDGTRNGIDLNAALPTWDDLVNESDASKRWFPLPPMENVTVPKADTQFEEAASGRMARLRQGKRSLEGQFWADDSTPTFLGKLEKSRCVEFGIFIVDINGNLIGSEENGFLYPIPVDNESWDPKFMFATDTEVQKIMLNFDWDRLFEESTMYQISSEEAGILFTTLKGLVDVNFTNVVGAATFDDVSFDAKFEYGTALNKIVYTGATNPTDWTIFNETTVAAVTVTGVTEGPDGSYVLTFAAQSSADVLRISTNKNGFIGETTVTLP